MNTFQSLAILASAICFSCCQQRNMPDDRNDTIPTDNRRRIDTVTSLTDQQDSFLVFKAPDGKYYNVSYLPEESIAAEAARFDCQKDEFFGISRKAAKTSIAVGSASPYTVLTNFLKTLKSDSVMKKHPGIKETEKNNRVAEESRNVKLTRVFMYAIKREDDNDYHIIIGDAKRNLLIVECSGLPAAASVYYNRLIKPRNQVKAFLGPLCMWNYRKFEPAVEVEVSGSLFFDKDHEAGVVGPVGLRPKTAWEIHPVTNIEFK